MSAAEPATPVDTLVVGAGVTGLACGHAAARAGRTALVLEASARAGGLVRTRAEDGYRLEEGPEALPASARRVRELCAELGIALHDAPREAARRFLWSDGKLLELPTSAEDLATSRVLPFGAKLRLLAEATCARDAALDGSIADFARHRFGSEALERVVEPLVAGLHAGEPEALSVRACFPEVVRMVEEHGSITAALKARARRKAAGFGAALAPPRRESAMFRPVGGMEELCRALARALGSRLRTGVAVRALERDASGNGGWRAHAESGTSFAAARCVLAVPLPAARALLAGVAPEAAAALDSMSAEGLVSVHHAYRRAYVAHPLDGSGYVVPRAAGGLVLGTLFASTIEAEVAPEGHVLLRSLLGGARRPDALELDDDELVERTHAECAGPLGLAGQPVLARVTRYPAVVPRYDLDHVRRREALARALPPGLHVIGDFTRGLGLETLLDEARAAAEQVGLTSC